MCGYFYLSLTGTVAGVVVKQLYVWRMMKVIILKNERIDRVELMRTFVRIVEAGSLSAAAKQMGTTGRPSVGDCNPGNTAGCETDFTHHPRDEID